MVAPGRLAIEIGDHRFVLVPGGYLRLPTDRRYSYVNEGRVPVTFVAVVFGP